MLLCQYLLFVGVVALATTGYIDERQEYPLSKNLKLSQGDGGEGVGNFDGESHALPAPDVCIGELFFAACCGFDNANSRYDSIRLDDRVTLKFPALDPLERVCGRVYGTVCSRGG